MRWASLRSAQPTAHRTRLRQRSLVTNPSSRIPAFRSVAHLLLAMLPALLGIEAQRGDRPRFQALEADFLVGLLAEAVAAFLDALERLVDLRDQLAVTVARSASSPTSRTSSRRLSIVCLDSSTRSSRHFCSLARK